MKEIFKTFLILMLMLTAVFLVNLIVEDKIITPSSEALELRSKDDSSLLANIIIPTESLLNFKNKSHTIFFKEKRHKLWTSARGLLNYVFSYNKISFDTINEDEDEEDYNNKTSIVFTFPAPVPSSLLSSSLAVKNPNNVLDSISHVSSIYINLESDPFIILSNEENRYISKLPKIVTEELKTVFSAMEPLENLDFYYSLKDHFNLDKDIFFPYEGEMKIKIPSVFVENEIRYMDHKQKRLLAEMFFKKDIDYIQEFIEDNGSAVFIYNQEVLKLNLNGIVEYFNALDKSYSNRNFNQSFMTAVRFMRNKLGLKDDIYLYSITEIDIDENEGYLFHFNKKINDLPVIFGSDRASAIAIEVFNEQVRSYEYFDRNEVNSSTDFFAKKNIISPLSILTEEYDFFIDEFLRHHNNDNLSLENIGQKELLSKIDNITLSYYDPCLKDKSDELICSWVFYMGNKLFCFNAETGTLLYDKIIKQ